MRSFPPPPDTRFYAGVDLHARSLYLVVLDRDGQARFGRNLPAAPEPFLRAVQLTARKVVKTARDVDALTKTLANPIRLPRAHA